MSFGIQTIVGRMESKSRKIKSLNEFALGTNQKHMGLKGQEGNYFSYPSCGGHAKSSETDLSVSHLCTFRLCSADWSSGEILQIWLRKKSTIYFEVDV